MSMFEDLAAPFPPERVSWRVGSTTQDKKKGMALAYIDARDVMERLDTVCGPAGWERRHPHVAGTTTCEIAIWIEDRGWVVKADGAGDTAVEAEKGSLSDSFKRAAVNWGIGRYLYDLPSPWVALNERKQIADGEHAKLEALLRRQATAPQATAPASHDADEPSAAVNAATLAISMCKTSAELAAWWAEHKDRVNALPDTDYLPIGTAMRARTAELKKPATALNPADTPEFA